MGKILESMATEVVTDLDPPVLVETEVVEKLKPEPQPKFIEKLKPEPEPKVVGLVSLQEEISSQSIEVEELLIETLLDLPVKPTMELVPSLATMRVLLSLRLPDEYNPFRYFYSRQFHRRVTP